MEDSYKDKNTADQAWNRMRATLDKEMPVQKDRRRAIWWFLPAICGVGLLIAYLVLARADVSTNNEVPQKRKIETTKVKPTAKKIIANNVTEKSKDQKGIAPKVVVVENNNQEINEFTSSSSNTLTKKIEKNISPSLTYAARKNRKEDNLRITTGSIESKNKNRILNSETAFLENTGKVIERVFSANKSKDIKKSSTLEKSIILENSNTNFKSQNEEIKPIPQKLVAKMQNREVDIVATIPRLALSPFPNTYNEIPSVGMEMIAPKVRQWEWTARLNMLAHFDGLSTVALEISTFRKISSKWKIGAGVGYKVISESGRNVNSSPLVGAEADFANLNSVSSSRELNYVYNINYFSIPLMLEYKLPMRWSLLAGLRCNILHRASQKHQGQESINLQNSNSGIINNFDFYAGPAYSITPHWSIGMILQQSTKFFKSIKMDDSRFQIGLSTNYIF